ncbi:MULTISPECIES: hypothetical protein [Rhizobium]|uniref:hypothetical protein n=1 Tax=Rhizobium TaxID=379 RepID=UPI0011A43354|nr:MULTISPECIES: hypothetical protein [Rhizobium]
MIIENYQSSRKALPPQYSERSKDFANGAAKDLEKAASAISLRRKQITTMGGTGIKAAPVG